MLHVNGYWRVLLLFKMRKRFYKLLFCEQTHNKICSYDWKKINIRFVYDTEILIRVIKSFTLKGRYNYSLWYFYQYSKQTDASIILLGRRLQLLSFLSALGSQCRVFSTKGNSLLSNCSEVNKLCYVMLHLCYVTAFLLHITLYALLQPLPSFILLLSTFTEDISYKTSVILLNFPKIFIFCLK